MKTPFTITNEALKLFRQEGNSSEEQMALLRLINTQIKREERLDSALFTLLAINPEIITSPGVLMYYYYLVAKGYKLKAKASHVYADILKASLSIAKVFEIAQKSAIRIKNPKYHFTRAYIYYQSASWSNQVDKISYTKTIHALSTALKSFQTPSIVWLQNELIAFANINGLRVPPSILEA